MSWIKRAFGVLLVWSALALPALGYIDVTPTLGRLVNQSTEIVVLRVDKVNLDKQAILFHKVADLKAPSSAGPIKHKITAGLHPREPATILEWVEPGQIAISFQNDKVAEICIGHYWYECTAGVDGWWIMNCGQAQLTFAYKGPVTRLREHIKALLAGQEPVITAVKFGADDAYWRACKRVVALRDTPQGNQFPICRFKASLKMSGFIYEMYRDPKFAVQLGAAGPEDVPRLVTALHDKDWPTRLEAAQVLGGIGPAAKEAVPALLKALQDPQASVRLRAAEALTMVAADRKEPLDVLAELRHSPDAQIRKQAAEVLGNIGKQATAIVPWLREALKDQDAKVRWAAAEALGRFGPDSASAAPALMAMIDDQEPAVRAAAIDALGSIGPSAKAAVPKLIEMLQARDHPLRGTVAAALYRIDRSQARPAIPIFIEEMKTSNTRIRWHGLYYLRKMVDEAKDALPVPYLIDALDDADFGVRGMAAWLLGELGPRAAAAAPALERALTADDVWIRSAAAPALVKILGPKASMALPVLIDGLADEDIDTREEFLQALQTMGPAARQALPSLLSLAKKDRTLRGLTAEAIWRISLEAETPAELLMQELEESDVEVRLRAIRLLGQIGPDAKKAVPALRALGHDSDPELREAGLDSLRKIDPDAWADVVQRNRQESIGWPWRLTAWLLSAALLSVLIGCWCVGKRTQPYHKAK